MRNHLLYSIFNLLIDFSRFPHKESSIHPPLGAWGLSLFIFITSCQGFHEPTEAELSDFGEYVYALDTLQLTKYMESTLKADTSKWKSDIRVKERYTTQLADFQHMPLWFSRMGLSSDADSLLAHLRREAPRNGLDTAAFFTKQIADDIDIVHRLSFDSLGININELLPRLDYNLSKAYTRYITGMHYGFMRPDNTFNHLLYKSEEEGYARLFDYEVKPPDYDETLQALTSEGRMDILYKSTPNDHVYQALQERLTHSADSAERIKLTTTMERFRWQMHRPGNEEKYILVNLAAQQLWLISPDSIHPMNICCGTTLHKTPLLSSEISYLQVNPDWIVPQTIVKKEFTHHAGDSAYFARHNYYIVNRASGDTLNVKSVSAADMKSGKLRIGQKAGKGNSLGRIVFRFPNDFSIYLHDTNNRAAFNYERRTLSHGCVRVQHPFELACFLLPDADEWTLDRLRISMDIKPESERGEKYLEEHEDDPRPLRLLTYHSVSPKVPVYITYHTAYPDPEADTLQFWPDIYGYDKVIKQELGQFMLK